MLFIITFYILLNSKYMALSLIVSFHLSTCNLEMEIFLNTFQGVCHGVENVLILAATNTPYALDQVRQKYHPSNLWPWIEKNKVYWTKKHD